MSSDQCGLCGPANPWPKASHRGSLTDLANGLEHLIMAQASLPGDLLLRFVCLGEARNPLGFDSDQKHWCSVVIRLNV